jgi:hypothetical protein
VETVSDSRQYWEAGYESGKRHGYGEGLRDGLKTAVDVLRGAPPPPIVIHIDQLPAWLTGRREMTEGDL